MAQRMVDQLVEIMPELAEVDPLPVAGRQRGSWQGRRDVAAGVPDGWRSTLTWYLSRPKRISKRPLIEKEPDHWVVETPWSLAPG